MNRATQFALRWLLVLLPLPLALVFSEAFSPRFAAPKTALLTFAAFALAALALMVWRRWTRDLAERRCWLAIAAYVALVLVSALHAPDRSLCLPSVIWTISGVLLLAAAAVALGGEDSPIRTLQGSVSLAAALVALLALAQFFAFPLPGGFGAYANQTVRMRMYSTLGNPDFVATFLAVALPWSIGLAVTQGRWRAVWIAVSAMTGGAILLTGSRGGVLAMAAGVVVALVTLLPGRARTKRVLLATLLLACAVAATTQLNARTPGESLRGRLFLWQVALSSGSAPSALGSGPGSFAYDYALQQGQFFALPGHDSLLRFAGAERHAQNDFVEAWHESGWLGLGSLLLLLIVWFRLAAHRLRMADASAKTAIAVALASVAAFCVAALFDFPMHRAESWGLLALALAVPLTAPAPPLAQPLRLTGLRIAAAALLLATGCWLAFMPLASSFQLAQGEFSERQGRTESAVAAYRAALRWAPTSPDANFNLIRALAHQGDYDGALTQSRLATRFVNEPELYLLRARILQIVGRDGEAQQEIESALRLFPDSTALRGELDDSTQPAPKAKAW